MLKQVEDKRNERKNSLERARQLKKRQTFFCIGASDVWRGKDAIHTTIKKLKSKHNIKWLRLSMSYHRFPNVAEAFSGDLNGKLNKGIGSKDFEDLPCNCNAASKINGECIFKGKCRQSIVIYKAICTKTKKYYIGNTQQMVKKRLGSHFSDVCTLANKNE